MGGKKSVAAEIVQQALLELSDDRKEAIEILEQAVGNAVPKQEVRSRRVGGATYQVPLLVSQRRAQTLAIRWLIQAARARKGMPMFKKLAAELKDAAGGAGEALKKRNQTHRMAESNRAFAHFRW